MALGWRNAGFGRYWFAWSMISSFWRKYCWSIVFCFMRCVMTPYGNRKPRGDVKTAHNVCSFTGRCVYEREREKERNRWKMECWVREKPRERGWRERWVIGRAAIIKFPPSWYEGILRLEFDCDTYTHARVCRYVRDRPGYKMFCKLDMLSAVYTRLPPTRVRPQAGRI